MIDLVKILFSLATLCFFLGLNVRVKSSHAHALLMGLGILATLGIAVVIIAGVHLFGASYAPAPWLADLLGGEFRARWILTAHRGLSSLTLVFLLIQAWGGLRKNALHRHLWKPLIPLWLVSYISGLVIFI